MKTQEEAVVKANEIAKQLGTGWTQHVYQTATLLVPEWRAAVVNEQAGLRVWLSGSKQYFARIRLKLRSYTAAAASPERAVELVLETSEKHVRELLAGILATKALVSKDATQ